MPAGGTRDALQLEELFFLGLPAAARHQRVHGIDDGPRAGDLARLHGTTGDEDGGKVEAQGGHQHARRDLVAVRDADEGVGAVGIDHVLDGVGDQLARRQAIQHALVAHGDAVIHRDGVELLRHRARLVDLLGHEIAERLEMDVAGHELGVGVGDGDNGLDEVRLGGAGGPPQGARRHLGPSLGRPVRAVCGHSGSSFSGLRCRGAATHQQDIMRHRSDIGHRGW